MTQEPVAGTCPPSDPDRRRFLAWTGAALAWTTAGSPAGAWGSQDRVAGYPIAADVVTTRARTVVPAAKPATLLRIDEVSKFRQHGYGAWSFGEPLATVTRTDLLPEPRDRSGVIPTQRLLRFFTISDIHITDKESPSQLIYLGQLNDGKWSFVTSIYSPVMLYTTHVLDAAVQTVNALHRESPIDFGMSLGDACNSTQYNELRWYIDVLDGKVIAPSSGAHAGAATIDYQKPYQAAGLDPAIPWYQAMGNHDHFWIGSIPVDDALRDSYVSDRVFATGDVLADPRNIGRHDYYMGVLDGRTPCGDIADAGPVESFRAPPRVVADPARRSLARAEWMREFFTTSSQPAGHGFAPADVAAGFACYSFVPKADVPVKVIVLDDTQREDDGSLDIHGHGFLDQRCWDWLKAELAAGQAAGQLMIIAAHVPIGVEKPGAEVGWWNSPRNAVTEPALIAELQRHPNFILWIAGHRHLNNVKAFAGATPEAGFWQVETSSLRDFPQQFRTFELHVNSDHTVSIVTSNVDPAIAAGTPAATSRAYAVAAQQIVNTDVYAHNPTGDRSVAPMPATGSYNAELIVSLTPGMQAALRRLTPAAGDRIRA